MLYKQAWEELKSYLEGERWRPEDEPVRWHILAKIRSLEDRWKIIPSKKGE